MKYLSILLYMPLFGSRLARIEILTRHSVVLPGIHYNCVQAILRPILLSTDNIMIHAIMICFAIRTYVPRMCCVDKAYNILNTI